MLMSYALTLSGMLSVDMVEEANSGHPGMPMSSSYGICSLTRFLKHNPENPKWHDRDRFVLSAGHGSALLYSLLHLTGYNLPIEEIKRFRQWEKQDAWAYRIWRYARS